MRKISSILLCFLLLGSISCQKDEPVSLNPKEKLETLLKNELRSKNLTSISYCVVKNDKILYSNALGFSDKQNNKLATDSTRYLIASISKTITAVAAMKLVEQQLIALDDDINNYLPFSVRNSNFPNDKITLRMLLSHRSSISDQYLYTLNSYLYCYGTDCSMSLDQFFMAVFLNNGQYYSHSNFSNNKPGTNEDYSNLGLALVGYLVERISQTPFDVYCKNNIFTPLGMSKTEWRLANTPLSELAIPYSNYIPNPTNPHYTFPDYPNGGLRTNVLDLSKFLRMVMLNGYFNNTQILSQASMTEMKTLQFGSAEFGLAFHYVTIDGKEFLGHSGGEMGVNTGMYYDQNNNVGVIIFNNDDDADLINVFLLLYSYGEKQ